jgi:ATP-dependent Clp protease ATP-binding subunit ClpX
MERTEILQQLEPEDLLEYGFIPEFAGRIPVTATLHKLDEDALVEILQEPKDALVKQYKRLFEMENVNLKFTDEALHAIADDALDRDTGARGLRSVMEDVMLDLMYDIPDDEEITECVITEEAVRGEEQAMRVYSGDQQEKESA